MASPTVLPAWQALEKLKASIETTHLRDLFARDPERFQRFSIIFGDLLFDYSKHRIDDDCLGQLLALAEQSGLEERRDAMFRGKKINTTEQRAALHIALRNRSQRPIHVDGKDVLPAVNAVLAQMRDFSEKVRSGVWTGYSGARITDVVNIGIGGSDLGPKMACEALTPYAGTLRLHFVSNVDGSDIAKTLKQVDPATTLFLVASKTFTTIETMTNAITARDWFLKKAGNREHIAKHFVALSTNAEAVAHFGIDTANMFPFWDWVGGRYSMWSAIGLSIALHVGMDNFEQLLEGAHRADEHFRTEPPHRNIPVIMAMLGVWYNNFFGAQSHAILPYDQYLNYFADYFQQVDMESNGKSVTLDGDTAGVETGQVIWGRPGTNGQHAFYQLIHQGTKLIPCDFLAAARSHNDIRDHHRILISNYFAQTEALMRGRTRAEARAELEQQGVSGKALDLLSAAKTFPGNRPSSSFLYRQLDPAALGTLLAFYEHKIFTQGVVWNLNSYDQMGVELGKILANSILTELADNQVISTHDSSTNGLINYYKSQGCTLSDRR